VLLGFIEQLATGKQAARGALAGDAGAVADVAAAGAAPIGVAQRVLDILSHARCQAAAAPAEGGMQDTTEPSLSSGAEGAKHMQGFATGCSSAHNAAARTGS